ncbi:hypothetical protein BZB76_3232 [Actinomadura pelletieri DSM 43383]|uniref:Uncharacterized protein n=1 Tax=Actinomadura pelletieri DSM 43383 TaxID=1120940 RepID=A0A495QP13_9ACTN|nr:hypothetical protein [Actinomadura pelletieri]RKS74715.1 hypothetical protein BZB76_3232 [Actinomadura pelletieri DSM 43383]
MKFELVQFPETDVPESTVEPPVDEAVRPGVPDGDPVAAVNAATAHLAAQARAEGERIGAALTELAGIVDGAPPQGTRWQAARPPGNFRAGRFSKGDAG